jgi:hypothetical protein
LQDTSIRDAYFIILRKVPLLLAIGIAGVLLRYCAFLLQTGDVSFRTYVEALCQWDCRWFVDLAAGGYELHARPNGEANWAFFPLLPILMDSLHALTGLPLEACGALIGQICIGLAAAFAALLFQDDDEAYWVFCSLLIIGPLSFYYSIGLSEALFVMLTVVVMVCVQRRLYLSAGIAVAFLSATRPLGVFAGLMILWQAYLDYRRGILPLGRVVLACLLAPGGLIAFMVYLHFHVGDALAFAHVQAAWHRSPGNPFLRMWKPLMAGPSVLEFWFSITAIGALLLSVLVALRGSVGAALFCFAALIVALSSGLQSMPRFVAGLVPLTMVLAGVLARPKPLRVIAVIIGIGLGFIATIKWIGKLQYLV